MQTLLSEIEAFIAAHEMSEWAFGEAALNDRHFIKQLRDDREPRRKTEAKVRHFMATYRPQQQVAA